MNKRTLIINRKKQSAGAIAAYNIIVDGKNSGKIRCGEEVALELPIGSHEISFTWLFNNFGTFAVFMPADKKTIKMNIKLNSLKGKLEVSFDDADLKNEITSSSTSRMELTAVYNDPKAELEDYIVNHPTISLKTGEICYFEKPAKSYHQKNAVVGRKSSSAGVSFRVAKGVTFRTGGGGSEYVREVVAEKFDGNLYITNQRIIMLAPKHGFDIPLAKITQLCIHDDGIAVYTGAKCYFALTEHIEMISCIYGLIRKVMSEQETIVAKPEKREIQHKSVTDNIREYKKLLDEGIITEEEFEKKKRQLLNL